MFGAYFTYERDSAGNYILDDNDKAIPTWEVYDNFSNNQSGIDANGNSHNTVYVPTQGTGFFIASEDTINLNEDGSEDTHLQQSNNHVEVVINRRNGSVQNLKPVAQSSYCDGFADLLR